MPSSCSTRNSRSGHSRLQRCNRLLLFTIKMAVADAMSATAIFLSNQLLRMCTSLEARDPERSQTLGKCAIIVLFVEGGTLYDEYETPPFRS